VTATARSVELRSIAQQVADALPTTVGEVVVTGSVSRGVADDISDIEMLVVTHDELELDDCYSLAAECGLTNLGTWGLQGGPAKRVSGYRHGVPIELVWWSHAHAEATVAAIFAGEVTGARTRWRTASPCGPRGSWPDGRSGSATIRTSSPALRSRTPRSRGEGLHPRVSSRSSVPETG
jgi:hypothetical protein